jgi:hypothetical protein
MMRWAVCSCNWLQSMASSRASHVSVTTYFSPNARRWAAGRRRECAAGTSKQGAHDVTLWTSARRMEKAVEAAVCPLRR